MTQRIRIQNLSDELFSVHTVRVDIAAGDPYSLIAECSFAPLEAITLPLYPGAYYVIRPLHKASTS